MEQICALKNFRALIATINFPCKMTCYAIKKDTARSEFNISIKSEIKQVRLKKYLENLYISR